MAEIHFCLTCEVLTHKPRCPLCGNDDDLMTREELVRSITRWQRQSLPWAEAKATELQQKLHSLDKIRGTAEPA